MDAQQLLFGGLMIGATYAIVTRARWLPAARLAVAPRSIRREKELVRLGGADFVTIAGAARAGDPAPLVQALLASREGSWARRAALSEAIAIAIPAATFDAWARRQPEASPATLLSAQRALRRAQQNTVPAAAAADAQGAGELFARAAAIDPVDPTPWIGRLRCELLVGGADVVERARGHFVEATRRDPDGMRAVLAWLLVIAPYWYGKPDEAPTEARAIAAASRAGSARAVAPLVARYHAWHRLRHWGKPGELEAYVRDPAVLAEVRAAYGASLGSPSYRENGDTIVLRNYAAFLFHVLGDKPLAAREIAAIGDRFSSLWAQIPSAASDRAAYEAAEAWARS